MKRIIFQRPLYEKGKKEPPTQGNSELHLYLDTQKLSSGQSSLSPTPTEGDSPPTLAV